MINAILGIIFLVSGTAATFLMYHLWGYPYDKEKHVSSAPQSLVFVHRFLGYIYIGIYVYLMIQMVPRMWLYQIELPARTVVHLVCGILIGAILIIKLMIVRFFRHLEGTLIPALGTSLLLLTVVVISLSVPFAIRESMLNARVMAGAAKQENLDRVKRLLENVGVEDEGLKAQLSTARGLNFGRKVLNNKCVTCHDLRTVLARPKTAKQWSQTVKSMANRADIFNPITQEEQWKVTAYLIAISPDLQRSAEQKSKIAKAKTRAAAALKSTNQAPSPKPSATQLQKQNSDAPAPANSAFDSTSEPTATSSQAEAEVTAAPESEASSSSDSSSASAPNQGSQSSSANPPAAESYTAPAGYSKETAKSLFDLKCTECHGVSKIEDKPPTDLEGVRSLLERMVGKGVEGTEEEFEFLIHYIKETYVK